MCYHSNLMTQRHPIQNDCVMFVTINTYKRIPFFKEESNAREAIECLYRVQDLHPFFLFAFVIMPDHCHFLLSVPPPRRISGIMNSYKSALVQSMGVPKLWQARFFLSNPEDSYAIRNYIHQNPVRASLVENPEDYPWSSASGKWDTTDLLKWLEDVFHAPVF